MGMGGWGAARARPASAVAACRACQHAAHGAPPGLPPHTHTPEEHDVCGSDVHLDQAHGVQLAEGAGHVVQQDLLLLGGRPRLAQHVCQREVAALGDDEGGQVLGALLAEIHHGHKLGGDGQRVELALAVEVLHAPAGRARSGKGRVGAGRRTGAGRRRGRQEPRHWAAC
jgi:hypothetical protein